MSNLFVRLNGKAFRPPWVKPGETWNPPKVAEWVEPEWFKEKMYGHPWYKRAHRIELEHFVRTGSVMKPATLAKRLAAERDAEISRLLAAI